MKSLSATILVTVTVTLFGANVNGASTGWAAPPQEPSGPASMDILLNAGFLASTMGEFGLASANQQVLEQVSGNSEHPGYILSSSGAQVELIQDGNIEEVAIAQPNEGGSLTGNDVQVQQTVAAASDTLQANLGGGNSASVSHSGDTYGYGGGFVGIELESQNHVSGERGTPTKVNKN